MKRLLWITFTFVGSLMGLFLALTGLARLTETAVAAAQANDFPVHVDYAHEIMTIEYDMGYMVVLTVTDGTGVMKAIATSETVTDGAGPGIDGVLLRDSDWYPAVPDIAPYDWISARVVATGDVSNLQIGEFMGQLDHLNDSITVTVLAPWLPPTVTVPVDCHPWGAPGGAPGYNFPLFPDGSDSHTCVWDPILEWDILPGQEVGLEYRLPNGSSVLTAYHEPAPAVQIWQNNPGIPAEGGNYRIALEYANVGDAQAENVAVISNMSGGNLLFITDTAPFIHTEISPDVHQWQIGTLMPGEFGRFYVYVQVTGSQGQQAMNEAQISTSSQYNTSPPEYLVNLWVDQIALNDTYLSIYQYVMPYEPYPGSIYQYQVTVCNDGTTTSDSVMLTDTLPLSTTLVAWWPDKPGWVDTAVANSLTLVKPAIPGYTCEGVHLQVALDPTTLVGSVLTNTVIIDSNSDLDPANNEDTMGHHVNGPYTDLYIVKSPELGAQLAPGGYVVYRLDYANWGNVEASPVQITDTLPANTTFVESWRYDPVWDRSISVTPDMTTTDSVMWYVEALSAGEADALWVRLQIDWDAPPGTILTNTATISPQPGEVDLNNNVSQVVEEVLPPGPNLRIFKDGYWSFNGDPQYSLLIENTGSQRVGPVTVTDTYPISLSLSGYFDTDYSRLITWTDYPNNHYFTAVFTYLNSGDNIWVNFSTTFNNQGVPDAITNTAVVNVVPGESNLDDNTSQVVLANDVVDVWVQKTGAACCGIEPNAPINYTITFGNTGPKEARDIYVSDFLPSELIFDSADVPPYNVSGGFVDWYFSSLPPGVVQTIVFTATVDPETLPGTPLYNLASISTGSNEINFDNNSFVHVLGGFADLGVMKTASSTAVLINTPLVYTIDVINNGPNDAFDVTVQDFLPPQMQFGGVISTSGGFSCGPEQAHQISCLSPLLTVGQQAQIVLRTNPTIAGGTTNFVQISSVQVDPNLINNADNAPVLVVDTLNPGVLSVTPGGGNNAGTTAVTIRGYNFEPGTAVFLRKNTQSYPLSSVSFVDMTTLRAQVPAGLPVNTYNLVVENSDGSQGRLLNAFTVYTAGPPTISSIDPVQGVDNLPVVIDIYGQNFANLVLAQLVTGSLSYPLVGVNVVDHTHLRATVPISLTPGIYDLRVINPGNQSGTLADAYTVVDADTIDDLLTSRFDFGIRPVSPQIGQTSTLRLKVYRRGGQSDLRDVHVAFYDGPPSQTSSRLIGDVIIPLLSPNSSVPVTQTWVPDTPGLFTLYAVIDANNTVPETDEGNNLASLAVRVRPLQGDPQSPQVDAFTIDNGSQTTNQQQVVLDVTASDNDQVAYLLYIEYIFVQSADTWVPVQFSDWLPYADAHASYDWLLQPWPGAHYLQAWVVDAAGNVSLDPGESIINYWPDGDIPIAHAQGHVYRWYLAAGDGLQARLTSITSDVDLYLWDENNELVATSQLTDTVDEILFTASLSGLYQLEVTGAEEGASYQLEVIPINQGLAMNVPVDIRGHVKGRGAPYSVVGTPPSTDPTLPLVPYTDNLLYLPVVIHP